MSAKRLVIRGRVQGVGYRLWMVETARTLGVSGWVRNCRDGSVEALVAGETPAVEELLRACRRGPRLANVAEIEEELAEAPEEMGFTTFRRRDLCGRGRSGRCLGCEMQQLSGPVSPAEYLMRQFESVCNLLDEGSDVLRDAPGYKQVRDVRGVTGQRQTLGHSAETRQCNARPSHQRSGRI